MSKIGGFASGLGEGLRTGLMVGKGIKDIKRDDAEEERRKTKFEWEKGDRDRQTEKQKRIDANTIVIRNHLFPPEAASVAARGISPAQPPMADAANVPINPIDAASVVPGVTQQQSGTRAPMANAVNVPAAGLKEPPPTLSRDVDIGKESMELNRAFYEMAVDGVPVDPAAVARFRQIPQILQQEGVVQSMKLLGMGDYEGALKIMNSSGKYRGLTLVEGKPDTYDDMGQKTPTQVMIAKDAGGKTITFNHAQISAGMRDYPEVTKFIQENRKIAADEKRADASMTTAQASKTAAEKKTKDDGETATGIDNRVQKANQRILKILGANEFSALDENNQNRAKIAGTLAGKYIREEGMTFEAAAEKALDDADEIIKRGGMNSAFSAMGPDATATEGTKKWGEFKLFPGLGGLR